MNHTSTSESLIDHVQVCRYCGAGITFVPATITWWRTTPDKRVEGALGTRVWCKGPNAVHQPDIYKAEENARYRAAKAAEQVGKPYDASLGTLGT